MSRRLLGLLPLAALTLGAVTASAAPGPHGAGYRLVLASNRDGAMRPYSIRPDGSRLTPLLRAGRALEPVAFSGDGTTVAYRDRQFKLYLSRADGTGLHALPLETCCGVSLSRDGKRIAFDDAGKFTVANAHGRVERRISGSRPDWSPSGDELVFARGYSPRVAIVAQPLRGGPRVLAHGEYVGSPRWSPDGRWIAYRDRDGVWAVSPDGTQAHRVARGEEGAFSWSPDGRRLAISFGYAGELAVATVEGRVVKRLRLGLLVRGDPHVPVWSPDGRLLALSGHTGDDPDQIWTVGRDGRGPRRLTSAGTNTPLGWTRLRPVRHVVAPLEPSERALGAHAIATSAPVVHLSADGSRAAFIAQATPTDCGHVSVWTPGRRSILRVSSHLTAPCSEYEEGEVYGVKLSGSRLGWMEVLGCGNYCDVALETATLTAPVPRKLTYQYGAYENVDVPVDDSLRGHGGLLVYTDGNRLVRVGGGNELCQESSEGDVPAMCRTLRRGRVARITSVSGELIAVWKRSAILVLDADGKVVRVFPFRLDEGDDARIDGNRIIVVRDGLLESYDVSSGKRQSSRSLPPGYRLIDVDGGVAVLKRPRQISLLRLDDGRSFALSRARGPVLAALEPTGLYYAHAAADGQGRLVFIPCGELVRRFPGASRVWWPWLLAGVLALAGVGAVLFARSRRRTALV